MSGVKMNQYICPPDPLSKNGDMALNWQKWRNDFTIFLKANKYIEGPMSIKAYLLRTHIGNVGQEIIEKLMSGNVKQMDNMDLLLSKLDQYFNKYNNEVEQRYKFFSSLKKEDETIENYVDRLKDMTNNCNFGTMKESLIRDKIIAELKDKKLIIQLISVENLNLPKLISIVKGNAIDSCEKKEQATLHKNVIRDKTFTEDEKKATHNSNNCTKKITSNPKPCSRCKQKHSYKACPAWGFKCEICGERNHYTNCCTYSKKSDTTEGKNNVHFPSDNSQSPSAPPLSALGNLYPNLKDMNNMHRQTAKCVPAGRLVQEQRATEVQRQQSPPSVMEIKAKKADESEANAFCRTS